MIYSFKNDYSEIAHEKILKRLQECATEHNLGYGYDKHTMNAEKLLKSALKFDDCDIHFLMGGTQTNLITISAFLKPYEAVICSKTGHINVHETGAIEGTGRKVLICESENGKVTIEGIKRIIEEHIDEHQVLPKMVYISLSTELGTVYTKKELENIKDICIENDLFLFLDGARLSSGLASDECDINLHDLATLTDAFYIGGTKNGCMLGEALIIINSSVKKNFRFYMKHKGALLAKSYIISIGFEVLFEDDLFFQIGIHENKMANLLASELKKLNIKFLFESSTNQIFPIFSNNLISKIKNDYLFEEWENIDSNYTVIRLVTSFSTTEKNILEFINYLKQFI